MPEKEIEVPEEPEESKPPEVEQLSFGMTETTAPIILKGEKSQSRKSRKSVEPKTNLAPRKAKARKTEQASLITKPAEITKKVPSVKPGRLKSPKVTPEKKEKTTAKRSRPKGSLKDNSKKLTSKVVLIKEMMLYSKPDRPKLRSKASTSRVDKPASKAGRPKKVKAGASKGKKPPAKAGNSSPVKAAEVKAKKASRSINKPPPKHGAKKIGTRKPRQTRMTIKSADAKTKVIIPAGWKPPTKRTSPTKRSVKTPKPKR
jgi:hypothetical protein